MKHLLMICCLATLAACSGTPYPMNAADYIAWSQSSAAKDEGAMESSFTVKEPFAEVERYLTKKSKQCLNATISESQSNSMRWNATEETLGDNHAAFLMHKDDPEIKTSKRPAAGVIMLAAEIRGVSSQETRVTIHYNSNDQLSRAVTAIKSWSKIRHVVCPKWRPGVYKYH